MDNALDEARVVQRRKRSTSASQATDGSLSRNPRSKGSNPSKRRSTDNAAVTANITSISNSSGLETSGSVAQQEITGEALRVFTQAAQGLGSATKTSYQPVSSQDQRDIAVSIDQLQQLHALQARMFQKQQQAAQQLRQEQEIEGDRKPAAAAWSDFVTNNQTSPQAQNLPTSNLQHQILQRLLSAETLGTWDQQRSSSHVATYPSASAKMAPTNILSQEMLQLLALLHQQSERKAAAENSAKNSDKQMLSMWLAAHQQNQTPKTNSGSPQYAALSLQEQASQSQLRQVLLGLGLGPTGNTLPASLDYNTQVILASLMVNQQREKQQQLQNQRGFPAYFTGQPQPTSLPLANTASNRSSNNDLVLSLLDMLQQQASGSAGLQQHASPPTSLFTQQVTSAEASNSSSTQLNQVDDATSSVSATNTRKKQAFSSQSPNQVECRVGQAVAYVHKHSPKHLPENVDMYIPSDAVFLSEYQAEIRRQLEYFTSTKDDVNYSVQGRKRKAILGQVGIRCKHCAPFNLRQRGRGAVYYPTSLSAVYQAAQNMATNHLQEHCSRIPATVRSELGRLRERRDTASGGKQYWVDACRAVGLVEDEDCLRFGMMEEITKATHKSYVDSINNAESPEVQNRAAV